MRACSVSGADVCFDGSRAIRRGVECRLIETRSACMSSCSFDLASTWAPSTVSSNGTSMCPSGQRRMDLTFVLGTAVERVAVGWRPDEESRSVAVGHVSGKM